MTLKEVGLKIKLAAPTGRAAKRLSEATGRQASTIHRMLQFTPEDGGFYYNEDQKLKADVLVVDEASMLDAQLCLAVLRAVPLTCRVILWVMLTSFRQLDRVTFCLICCKAGRSRALC